MGILLVNKIFFPFPTTGDDVFVPVPATAPGQWQAGFLIEFCFHPFKIEQQFKEIVISRTKTPPDVAGFNWERAR